MGFTWPALSLMLALTALANSSPAHALSIPPTIEGVSLVGSSGHKISTSDGSKLTVVVFLSSRCPCSTSHEPMLAALASEFSKEANFVGIHSNADEPIEESATHFKKAALPFPVLQDEGAKFADHFGALKTPHAFILGKDGKVLFQGGVDDSHTTANASKTYLKTALESLRAGRAPEIARARAIGCVIRR